MITVVVAGDANYARYVTNAKKCSEDLGYPVLIYDLGGLGFGKVFEGKVSTTPLETIPCKPRILLDAIDHVTPDDFIVWLDADALMLGRIDEIQGDYDIGVTLRSKPAPDPRVSWVNAGIIFVKNTANARQFLHQWDQESQNLNGDQWALNKICRLEQPKPEEIVVRYHAKIKLWPGLIYNNFYFKKSPQPQAKILHYKSKLRNLYPL